MSFAAIARRLGMSRRNVERAYRNGMQKLVLKKRELDDLRRQLS